MLLDNLDGGLLFGECGILHNTSSSTRLLLPEADMPAGSGAEVQDGPESPPPPPPPTDDEMSTVAWAPLGASMSMDLDDEALWS